MTSLRADRVAPEKAAFRPALPRVPKPELYGEATMTTYAEKLRDPRWQKQRLLILERDNWTCQSCFKTTETLHVHHKYYQRNREPWDYPDASLITLCATCHELETDALHEAIHDFVLAMKQAGAMSEDFHMLAAALIADGHDEHPRWHERSTPFGALAWHMRRIIVTARAGTDEYESRYLEPMRHNWSDA